MSDLLSLLRSLLDRPVVDNSGITGTFEFRLIFAIDPSTADSGPSLFTALQQQLGLKLDAARGPADALVIERAEIPEAN
jgi:uncharacterized protein (TIGR03435 family)